MIQEDLQANSNRSVTIGNHLISLLKKSGPISVIFITNSVAFIIKRGIISRTSIELLDAHVIARTIAEMIALPLPRLLSQDAVYIAKLYGALQDGKGNRISEQDEGNLKLKIGDIVRQGYVLSSLFWLFSGGLMFFGRRAFISWYGASDEVSQYAADYLLIYTFALPFYYMLEINERILSSVDQEKWFIPYRLLLSGTNILLSFLLIPHWGLSGAAAAEIGKNVVGMLMLMVVFALYKPIRQFQIVRCRFGDFENMKSILLESIPALFYELGLSGSSYVTSLFMSRLNQNNLAFYQVPNEIYGTWSAINDSISQASNRLIGQYYGAKNYVEMRRVGNTSIVLNAAIYLIGFLVISIFYRQFSSLFFSYSDLNQNLSLLFRIFMILGLSQLGRNFFNNFNANLLATNDSLLSNMTWLLCAAIFTIPLAAVSKSVEAISITIGSGSMVAAIFVGIYWFARSAKIYQTDDQVLTSNDRLVERCSRFKLFCCKPQQEEGNDENALQGENAPTGETFPLLD